MSGNKFLAILATMIAGAAALAVAGLYLDWPRRFLPSQESTVAAPGEAPAPAETQSAASAVGETGAQSNESTGALTPPSEPTAVPTFDVVVIEPSGEGVIAGRAAPGWKVDVQSGGVKVAEAKADLQGEWSVVLEEPLPSGDHALSLKILSPDGTQALSSQETVRVAVGAPGRGASGTAEIGQKAASPAAESLPTVEAAPPEEIAAAPPAPSPQKSQEAAASPAPAPAPPAEAEAEALPPSGPDTTRALPRSEQTAATDAAAPALSARARLVFKTVDYQQSESGAGTVTITGTSEPGSRIVVFHGSERLAEARADREGQWRIAVARSLGIGSHSFRAERVGAQSGTGGTALVTIERVEPKPEPPPAAVAAAEPGDQVAARDADGQPSAEGKRFYVIQRGDTLWSIAKRYLGSGLRYTWIFEDNRKTIQDPDLIHPQQEVKVPAP